jgi:hypothetical protein
MDHKDPPEQKLDPIPPPCPRDPTPPPMTTLSAQLDMTLPRDFPIDPSFWSMPETRPLFVTCEYPIIPVNMYMYQYEVHYATARDQLNIVLGPPSFETCTKVQKTQEFWIVKCPQSIDASIRLGDKVRLEITIFRERRVDSSWSNAIVREDTHYSYMPIWRLLKLPREVINPLRIPRTYDEIASVVSHMICDRFFPSP